MKKNKLIDLIPESSIFKYENEVIIITSSLLVIFTDIDNELLEGINNYNDIDLRMYNKRLEKVKQYDLKSTVSPNAPDYDRYDGSFKIDKSTLELINSIVKLINLEFLKMETRDNYLLINMYNRHAVTSATVCFIIINDNI